MKCVWEEYFREGRGGGSLKDFTALKMGKGDVSGRAGTGKTLRHRNRITEWLTWKEPLVQPLCSSRVTWSQLPRTASRQLLIISKDENPMNYLCQYSIILTVKCFLMFRGNHLFFSLRSLPLFLSLDTTVKSLSHLLPSHQLYTTKRSLCFFFSRLKSQLPDYAHRKDAPNHENTALNLSVSKRLRRFLQGLNYCLKEM